MRRLWRVLAGLAARLVVDSAGVLETLQWQRVGIMSGAWWRGISGHVVHLNTTHAAMNVSAFILIMLLLGRASDAVGWVALWVGLSMAISVSLLVFDPYLNFYAGASGVLHGLVSFGALAQLSERRGEAVVLLIGLVLKLCWEHYYGAASGTVVLIGAPVIVNAHLYGAMAGVVPGAFVAWR